MLRCISGCYSGRDGTVRLGGQPIHTLPPAEVIAAGVVQVPQQDGLFTTLTVRDNMLLGGYLMRRDKTSVAATTGRAGGGLSDHRRAEPRPAGDLSGGQRRIVEFARALVTKPK